MIDIYTVSFTRNKIGIPKKDVNSLKKEIYTGNCEECKREMEINRLELDHIIPVRIGGNIISKGNLQLLCMKCHCRKSQLDRRVIETLKRMNIISRSNIFFIHPETVKKEFLHIRELTKEGLTNNEIWMEGEVNKDYKQIFWRKNKEDEDGTATN